MKRMIWIILCCVGLVFFMAWWLWSAFVIQRSRLCSESSLVFADVMRKEKTIQIGRLTARYDSKYSPNEIGGVEKAEWCDQAFLFYRDSTRTLLDSLFRTALLGHNIHAKTAIRCVWEGRVIDTSSDSTFYKEALPLRLFIYQKDEDPHNKITLQAYIKIPFGTVWRHSYLMWIISGLGLLLLGAVIGGYRFWYRKIYRITKQELQLQQEKQQQELERQVLLQQQDFQQSELQRQQEMLLQQQQQLRENEERFPSLFIQNKTIKWMNLSNDLLFNEEHGDLCYRNEVNLRLSGNLLKLFLYFIKAEQQQLTSKKICIDILGRSVRNELSRSDQYAVSNTIRHLRIHLRPLPFIEIEPVRGIGYKMIISSPENSSETTTCSKH